MQEKISKKMEDALQSIDGIEKASAPAFFFTRLEARMQREKNVWEKVSSFIASPAVAFSCISFVIMMNAYIIFTSPEQDAVAQQANELATVDEYSQVSSNLYEFENNKP